MREDLGGRMIERQVTPTKEAGETYLKVGVVVFILNEKGEVLVVRENFSGEATKKNAGEFGVICETSREGETWQQTLMRGLQEELGLTSDKIENSFIFNPNYCFLGETVFVEGVLARVAVIGCNRDIFTGGQADSGGEISVIGWERPERLISYSLRIGVRNVLERCLEDGLLSDSNLVFNDEAQQLSFLLRSSQQ